MNLRLVLTIVLGTFPLAVHAADRRPNIVIIMADDLGWNGLGCYGSELVSTPNIDRLASEGMRFTDAYAMSQCLPTRAAMFSGQYGARTGLTSVETASPAYAPMISPGRPEALDPAIHTLFEMLRDAGYETGMSGKLHLGSKPASTRAAFQKAGAGAFQTYGLQWIGPASPNQGDKHVTAITNDMIGFIEEHRDRPFVAYLAHHAPHTPLEAPETAIERAAQRGFKRSSDAEGLFTERVTADYLAMIEHLDESVGRVMDRLEDLKLTENTFVLFLSDNGGLTRVWRNDPLRGGKGQLYEGGIRVPLIVRWPAKVRSATSCDTPIHVIDLYPTLMEIADGEVPQEQTLDGRSIVALLTESGELKRDALFSHHPEYVVAFAKTPCSMIRKGDDKLIHYFGDYLDPTDCVPKPHTLSGRFVLGPRTELYNLADDPGEAIDLASENPGKTKKMMSELEQWWKETGATLPRPNPDMDRGQWIWNNPAETGQRKIE